MSIISALLFQACNKKKETEATNPKTVPSPSDNVFFKNNIAFYDARIRSISKTNFVREIFLVNMSDQEWKKTELTFEDVQFKDDGTGNDLKANDGIFTSVITFPHDNKIVYNENQLIKSVLSNPVVSPQYKYRNQLEQFGNSYNLRKIPSRADIGWGGPVATIECDVEWVCGCWNTCCGPVFSNCHVVFGWH